MTSKTPHAVFQELLAMWKPTNADFKQMHSVPRTQEPLNNPTCLRHLVFPIRMCWHTSFWTTGWELLSSWVRKLIQKPCSHHKIWEILLNVHETTEIQKTHFLYSLVNKRNASGHLPHRVSAECSCRGCLQHMWVPCREYAGCSGVCGQSHPPDAYPLVCVLLDKNCNKAFVSIIVKTSRKFRSNWSIP